jgi:O-antigen/teichoic acid export membrane protein
MDLKQEILKKATSLTIWQIISKGIGIFYFALIVKLLRPFQYGILGVCLSIFETFSAFFLCINTSLVKFVAEKKQKDVLNKG